MSVLAIADLRVEVCASGRPVVDGLELHVGRGQVVGLIGATGAGKTTVGLAALGHARQGLRIAGGSVRVAGTELVGAGPGIVRSVRRGAVGHVPQDAAAALNPARRIGRQIAEVITASGRARPPEERLAAVLDVVRLPDSAEFLRRYPHQLSGGQQQRVCLAIALAAEPALIVLDEPATGLDRPTRSEMLDNVRSCCDNEGLAVLLISHDLAAVTDISDRVVVMRDGRIVEEGPSSVVLDAPVDQFTRRLVAVTPATCGRAPAAVAPPPVAAPSILAVHDLTASHRGRPVVGDATFDLRAGECLALVGDSAAGKTTLARSIVGLHHDWTGTIDLDGAALARRSRERTVAARRAIQYVFQNPALSLNPRRTIGASVARPLLALGERRSTAQQAAVLMLERVSLPAEVIHRWPREMSGGELQRAAIARALVVEPRLLLCDEVTASLDPIVQATILELLRDLQRELGLSILLISHDLDVVAQMAHRVVTLSDGTVEVSSTVADASAAVPGAADQNRRHDGDHQLQR